VDNMLHVTRVPVHPLLKTAFWRLIPIMQCCYEAVLNWNWTPVC